MNAPINNARGGSSTCASTATSSTQHQSPANAANVPAAPAPAQVKAPTDPFLKDSTLVAEAAKRAQVAVMVRDFEDCGIS